MRRVGVGDLPRFPPPPTRPHAPVRARCPKDRRAPRARIPGDQPPEARAGQTSAGATWRSSFSACRGDGHGQGRLCASPPRGVPARFGPVPRGELRANPGGAGGGGALRLRERRVHRCRLPGQTGTRRARALRDAALGSGRGTSRPSRRTAWSIGPSRGPAMRRCSGSSMRGGSRKGVSERAALRHAVRSAPAPVNDLDDAVTQRTAKVRAESAGARQ